MVTEQGTKLYKNMAREDETQKIQTIFRFWLNIYMKVFGGQTNQNILTGRDMPYFTGDNGNFSIKNK